MGVPVHRVIRCVFSERIRARDVVGADLPSRPRRVTVQAMNRPARRSGPTNTEDRWGL